MKWKEKRISRACGSGESAGGSARRAFPAGLRRRKTRVRKGKEEDRGPDGRENARQSADRRGKNAGTNAGEDGRPFREERAVREKRAVRGEDSGREGGDGGATGGRREGRGRKGRGNGCGEETATLMPCLKGMIFIGDRYLPFFCGKRYVGANEETMPGGFHGNG